MARNGGGYGRDRFPRPDGTTGASRKVLTWDGTVCVGFNDGTRRHGQVLSTRRDIRGSFVDGKGRFPRRGGTVKCNGGSFLDGTGRYEPTVGEVVDGTGRRFFLDDGGIIPSRPYREYRPVNRPCKV